MKTKLLITQLLVLLCLTGCHSANRTAPIAHSTNRSDLVAAVLSEASSKDREHRAIQIEHVESTKTTSGIKSEKVKSIIKLNPKEVIKLSDSALVLVSENAVLDEQYQNIGSHVFGAYIGFYRFENVGENKWKLTEKNHTFENLGYFGEIGKTTVHKWGGDNFLLAVSNGSCWQGNCLSHSNFYLLSAHKTVHSIGNVQTGVDTTGFAVSCDTQKIADLVAEGRSEVSCEKFSSALTVSNEQLIFDFQGSRYTLTEKQINPPAIQRTQQSAVYALRNGKLELIRGHNPTFGF